MNNPVVDQVCQRMIAIWPVERFADVTTLVAVSGGADSVCLLRCLNLLIRTIGRGRLVVAHLNHALRAEESDADARFVAELAKSLGLDLICETASAANGQPSEESLRELRYGFFQRAAGRSGARYVAIAHTADDVSETCLHHLFRGTGPAGLAGIPAFRDLGTDLVIARPMINVRRQHVIEALRELNQAFRHDASNDADHWNRNWLRNDILPTLRQRYPEVDAAITRAAGLLAGQQADLRSLGLAFLDQFATREPHLVAIDTTKAKPVTASVFVTAMTILWDQQGWSRQSCTQNHWETLWSMATTGEPKSCNLPGNLRASFQRAEATVKQVLVIHSA